MTGQLTFVTLPVTDLDAGIGFYEAVFGWRVDRRRSSAAFFKLPAVTVALMERQAFGRFVGGEYESPGRTTGLCSWNVSSAAEVNALTDRALHAGARVRREPAILDWGGWAGVIASPDGHLWEIVWNPQLHNPAA